MKISEIITEENCKYGKYYCSTDKKVKCRKSPKKSRTDEKCWDGYEKKGMKTMFGKRVPDCVKKEDKTNENLRDWFGKGKKGGAGGGGWDRYNTKGERIGKCGDAGPKEGKPKCLSKSAAAKLRAKGGKKAIAQAVSRKRRQDPNKERRGPAKNVTNKYEERK